MYCVQFLLTNRATLNLNPKFLNSSLQKGHLCASTCASVGPSATVGPEKVVVQSQNEAAEFRGPCLVQCETFSRSRCCFRCSRMPPRVEGLGAMIQPGVPSVIRTREEHWAAIT